MYRLRVYDADGGDCLALRNGRHTEFIFDTGRKSSVDFKRPRGFALALKQAFGRGDPPVVVLISHIDGDHIGGLLAWVEHLIWQFNGNWLEAGYAAQKQVSQVWCNVPIPDVALARAFDVPVFDHPLGSGAEQGRLSHGAGPVPEILDHHLESVERLVDLWISRTERTDGLPPASGVSSAIQALEENLEALWTTPWDADSPNRNHVLETLDVAFPEEREFIGELRRRGGARIGNSRIVAEFLQFHPGWDMSIHMNIAPEQQLDPEDLDEELDDKRNPFVRHRSWVFERMSNDSTGYPKGFRIGIHDTTNDPAVVRAVDEARTFPDAVEVILNHIAKDETLDSQQRDRLVILRALFGRLPIEGWKERLGLFTALRMLGIAVRGIGPHGYLGEGVLPPPGLSLAPIFLSPDSDALRRLAQRWSEYANRLQVAIPAEALLFRALAADDSFSWKPDRSPTNLSSLSVWFEKIGSTAVALTGDGLHGRLMDVLKRTVPKKRADRLLYQIPHHGSRYNTNINKDPHPAEVLSVPMKRVTCLATGGQLPIPAGKRRLSRPHRQVVGFFAEHGRFVRAREVMQRRQLPHFDIELG